MCWRLLQEEAGVKVVVGACAWPNLTSPDLRIGGAVEKNLPVSKLVYRLWGHLYNNKSLFRVPGAGSVTCTPQCETRFESPCYACAFFLCAGTSA